MPVKGISSDDNGYYRIEALPAGGYTIEVSFVGFETTRLEKVMITENNETALDIKLKVSSELSVVRVSAVSRGK